MIKTLFITLALLATSIVVASPAPGAPNALPQVASTVFRAIYPELPLTLDPQTSDDPAAWPIIMTAYQRLMTLAPGKSQPQPALARTVRVSQDGLKYTFVLQEGLSFEDGTPIDSQAVLYSFERLMTTSIGQRYYPYLKSFEVVGPFTFRLILNRPWPPFLASLALPQASLVSPGLKMYPPGYLNKRTLGSGIYQVSDWQENTITLSARSDLVTPPKVLTAMFHFEPDPVKRFGKTLAHQVHLTIDPQMPKEGLSGQYRRLDVPSFAVRYLAFNTQRFHLKDAATRRGLVAVVSEAFKDHPGPLSGPFPPGFFSAGSKLPPDLSVSRAQALNNLKSVALPAAPLIFIYPEGSLKIEADAQLIAASLRKYGLKINLVPFSGDQGRRLVESGDYDLFLGTRPTIIPAADMWLAHFVDSASSPLNNPAFFKNAQADRLIQDLANQGSNPKQSVAEIGLSSTQRVAKLAELAVLGEVEAPYAFLYQVHQPLMVDVRLGNMMPHPMWPDVWPLDRLDLKPFSFQSGANPTGRPPAPVPPVRREARAPRQVIPIAAPVPPVVPSPVKQAAHQGAAPGNAYPGQQDSLESQVAQIKQLAQLKQEGVGAPGQLDSMESQLAQIKQIAGMGSSSNPSNPHFDDFIGSVLD